MKKLLTFIPVFTFLSAFSQDKYNSIHFNKLTEVEGTEYVLAAVEHLGKMADFKQHYLLFINTKTGQTNQIEFPREGFFGKIEQIKIDELGINKMIISAQTLDLNGKKGIDWQDPTQIFIVSPDGKEKTQLTDSSLFVRNWIVNKKTGTIVVTGHYDTNQNGKYDKADQNEVGIYDLNTLTLIKKI